MRIYINKIHNGLTLAILLICTLLCHSCKTRETETTVCFRVEGFITGHMKGTCENSTCSHTDSGVYYTDGHDITTGIITVPDGQVWDYKDYTADYKIPSDYGSWITRPYIIYSVDGVRWKKCKLPEDARNVRFFSGDQLRIGTYAAATSGRYDFIDIKVAFHISYLE